MCLTFAFALAGGLSLCDPPRALVLPRDPRCGFLSLGPPCAAGLIRIGRPFLMRNEPRQPEIAHCFLLMKGRYEPLRAVMTYDQVCAPALDAERQESFRHLNLSIF